MLRIRIRDRGSGAFLTPGPWMGKNQDPGSGSGIRIRDPDPGLTTRIIFPRAYKQFFGLKHLNSLMRMRMRIRDPESFDPGSGIQKFRSGIRDKHPGSATLLITRFKFFQIC